MIQPGDLLPAEILAAIQASAAPGLQVYLVGGAIRDALLGRPAHDLDFAAGGNVKSLARGAADQLGCAIYTLDDQRSQYRLIRSGTSGDTQTIDFAPLRSGDIVSDLASRDFTINAMAMDINDPARLVDPLGGARDLKDHLLRLASPQALTEDPVRILRGLRLAPLYNLRTTPPVLQAMRRGMPGLVRVSPERLRDELFRILDSPHTSASLRALELLGGLPQVFPELAALKDVPQTAPHYQDVWNHTLSALDHFQTLLVLLTGEPSLDKANLTLAAASISLGRFRSNLVEHFVQSLSYGRQLSSLVKLAVLYHDSAKPQMAVTDPDGRIHNYDHEQEGAQVAAERGRALQLSRNEVSRLETIVRNHMRIHSLAAADGQPSRRAVYRFFRDCGSAGIDICLHTLADTLGTYGPALPQDTWQTTLDVCRTLMRAWWEGHTEQVAPALFLNGDDIQHIFGVSPGPQIGRLLEALREAQAEGIVQDLPGAEAFIAQQVKAQTG